MKLPSVFAGPLVVLTASSACGQAMQPLEESTTVEECAQAAPEWLWCDDFERDRLDRYFEVRDVEGSFVRAVAVGLDSSTGMRARFAQGQVDAGFLHLAIGRSPDAYRRSVSPSGTDIREVYWRVYVKNEASWEGGGGDKLSRAFVFHGPDNWGQAMIAHVWSGGADSERLVIDPASGTDDLGNLLTMAYNDFPNLRWLGSRSSNAVIFSDSGIGKWYCVEAYVRLNEPGVTDGVFRLWIDDHLEAERTELNWVGSYNDYGLNAVYLENYWNAGSPKAQERYLDNFVVSTDRIGCSHSSG